MKELIQSYINQTVSIETINGADHFGILQYNSGDKFCRVTSVEPDSNRLYGTIILIKYIVSITNWYDPLENETFSGVQTELFSDY